MDPLWLSGGAAVANSAAGLLGMLGTRGPSERDLMVMQKHTAKELTAYNRRQNEIAAKRMPRAQMAGLKAAGINPMIPFAGAMPSSSPVSPGGMPGVAAPVNRTEPLMKGIQAGVASAMEVARTMADIDRTKAQTTLTAAQTGTELERPAQVRAQTGEAVASTLNKQQQARLSVFDQALRREDIKVREREAIVAQIKAGLWKEADQVIVQALRKLKISETVVPKVLGTIDALRQMDEGLRKGGEAWFSSALQWWRRNFDSSQEEKKHWPR